MGLVGIRRWWYGCPTQAAEGPGRGLQLMRLANPGLVSLLASIAVLATFASSAEVQAHAANSSPPTLQTGVIVSSATQHDRSAPLTQMVGAQQQGQHVGYPAKALPRRSTGNSSPSGVSAPNPAPAIPATLSNFDGVGAGFVGPAGPFVVNSAPPDTNA